MKIMKIVAMAVLCLIGPTMSVASALEILPFDSANQNPIVQIYGLPSAGNFRLLAPGRTEVGMNVALSSNYAADSTPWESIVLDGETARFTFLARHAFSNCLEGAVKIPLINHGGGFLDGFIEDFHTAFGFSQGGRDQAPRNRLLYLYRRNGSDMLRFDNSGTGIGDVALTAAFQLYDGGDKNRRVLALNFGVKLPTGDSDELRGSGSTDISLWINGGMESAFTYGRWGAYGAAGMLYLTEGDVLPDQQKEWVGFGSIGLGWSPVKWIAFKVQADAHTSFFSDSDLDEIAANAVQLTIGGTVGLSEKTALDLGVSEDLTVSASPDVVFYLTLRFTP